VSEFLHGRRASRRRREFDNKTETKKYRAGVKKRFLALCVLDDQNKRKREGRGGDSKKCG
jgi:hypothetical protein